MEIYTTPTREEFFDYAYKHGWNDWAEELWEEMNRTNWLKNDGTQPKNWHTIVNVRNGYIKNRQNITSQEPKLFSEYAKGKKKKEKVVINEITEEFPDNDLHYVCYTDGFCDYHSEQRVGSAAYIIVHDGKIIKEKNHGQLNTNNNRMELLSIISAVKSCPNGAYVDIYTDSQYCVLVLSKSYSPAKNADFYDLYRECSSHLAEVRFHWIESQTTNKSINYAQRLIGTLVNNMELRNYMKINKIMDSIRKTTPENTNKQVDFGVAIANRVYDLLKERNMTQRDFAKALNKTETEVSRWLSGTHNLTLSSIAKMATVLGDDIITTTHTLHPYKIPDVEQYATSVAEEIHT